LSLPTTPSADGGPELLQGYRFAPTDLDVGGRAPGISAFMRIRNGEEFLEATIRSHIECFDEIVAVYNQCTDRTESILLSLRQEFGPRLRVIHYVDRVFPPGSEGHASTPPDSPHSLVNYYNAALAATRHAIATKLDDDHLAIAGATRDLTARLRRTAAHEDVMHCFSGLNLIRGPDGELGVMATTPISGGGDIGFFPVRPDTWFAHDRRFERFRRGSLRRCFAGFLYWHLKYLKAELGFANYELGSNPRSRYARRQRALADGTAAMIPLPDLPARLVPGWPDRLGALLSAKKRLKLERDAAVAGTFPDATALDALRRTADPRWVDLVLAGAPRPGAAATG
jgi:hypothetical protein